MKIRKALKLRLTRKVCQLQSQPAYIYGTLYKMPGRRKMEFGWLNRGGLVKGNNSISFNMSTMIDAVQFYLSGIVFKVPVKVVSVKSSGKYDGFEIDIEEPQPAEIQGDGQALRTTAVG